MENKRIDYEATLQKLFNHYKHKAKSNVESIIRDLEDIGITGDQNFASTNYLTDNDDEEKDEEESAGCSIKQRHVQKVLHNLSKNVGNALHRIRINSSAEITNIFVHMKTVAEQLQQFAEIEATIARNEIEDIFAELYPILEKVKELEVDNDVLFNTQWTVYNLIILTNLATLLNMENLAVEINKNIIVLIKETFGEYALQKQAYGIAFHNIAIYHKTKKEYEKCLLYYQVALAVYNLSSDWTNEHAKLPLCMQLEESSKTVRQSQRGLDVVEAWIGEEGGRLNIEYCEVKIPRGALDKMKKFNVFSKAEKPISDETIPISTTLTCEPPTNFKLPVKMLIPSWCGTDVDYVTIQIFCKQNVNSEWEVLDTRDMKNIGCDIYFDTMHFSCFRFEVDKFFHRNLKYNMGFDVWKSSEGNYLFITYIKKYKTIEKEWKKDFESRKYEPTQAIFNSIDVHNGDKIQVCFESKSTGITFSQPDTISFNIDFAREYYHHEQFALKQTGPHDKLATIVCQVEHNNRKLDARQWNENMSIMQIAKENIQEQKYLRLTDVFRKEIIESFKIQHLWTDFAKSNSGLALNGSEVAKIEELHQGNFQEQKMEMLQLWKSKITVTGWTEQQLIDRIRGILKHYRPSKRNEK